jgi:hypothetical protein
MKGPMMKWNGFGPIAISAVATAAACLLWTGGSATAGPAQAGQARTITCGAMTGVNTDDHRLIVSSCTGPTGGFGTFEAPMHSPFTVHWASGKSSEVSFTKRSVGPRTTSCLGQFKVVGKVTETSISSFTKSFSGSLCLDSLHHVTLAPGTRIKF